MMGIVMIFGALQAALFMTGRHAAELAAYRSSRVLEEGGDSDAAREEAERVCAIGYPKAYGESAPTGDTVRLRMEPLMPLFASGAVTVEAHHPPVRIGP
jgi:hypothetical protein